MAGAMTPTETARAGRRLATLSIGDVRVQLTSSDHDLALDIPPVITPFVCDRDHADARVDARVDVIEPARIAPGVRLWRRVDVETLRR